MIKQEKPKQLILHPMYLFSQELKNKELKNKALSSVTTISLALGTQKTRCQLIPYLASIFPQESTETKKYIIKALTSLLHEDYLGRSKHGCCILEVIIDVLCVYDQKDIREEGYLCLEKVLTFIDVRKAQEILLTALNQLHADTTTNENSPEVNRNIRELVLKIIPFIYMGVEEKNEQHLLQLLNSYKGNLEEMKLVAEVLKDLICVMPPVPETYVRQVMDMLLNTGDQSIYALLVEPLVLLGKIAGEESTKDYLQKLLENPNSVIICAFLKVFNEMSSVFSQQALQPLMKLVEDYDSQPQDVKNSILLMYDNLPLTPQTLSKVTQPPNSLQLKNTLAESLCRTGDTQNLHSLLSTSDANFTIKLFPKLPPLCEFHVGVLENVLKNKAWRLKLTIFQNLAKRMKEGENIQILIPVLTKALADKIASIRNAAILLLAEIFRTIQLDFASISQYLQENIKSRNWFERQCGFRVVIEMLNQGQHLFDVRQLRKFFTLAENDPVNNIRSLADDANVYLH